MLFKSANLDMKLQSKISVPHIFDFSQSPDDFDQRNYNFAREMGLSIVFSCVLEKPKMLEALLGGKVDPKRLSQLGAGVALTRLPGTDAPSEVIVWKR